MKKLNKVASRKIDTYTILKSSCACGPCTCRYCGIPDDYSDIREARNMYGDISTQYAKDYHAIVLGIF